VSETTSESIKTTVPEDGLGERIRQRREEKNFTQEALSVLTKSKYIDPECKGVSRPAIVGYEKNSTLPGARELRILAEALDVTPSWLVLGRYDTRRTEDTATVLIEILRDFVLQNSRDDLRFLFSSTKNRVESLDPDLRASLEIEAREMARAETQKRNKGR